MKDLVSCRKPPRMLLHHMMMNTGPVQRTLGPVCSFPQALIKEREPGFCSQLAVRLLSDICEGALSH